MGEYEKHFVDRIAKHCIDQYLRLPKTGKPIQGEYTVLSCVVKYNLTDNEHIEVVSLGTGTKCIGSLKMSSRGDILNDSHAEVFARRGFMVYLYENIKNIFEGKPSIFTQKNGKCVIKNSIAFGFYSSQLPCGDAAVFPKTDDDLVGDVLEPHLSKRRSVSKICEVPSKLSKLKNGAADIHRTGAKCLQKAPQDSREAGISYHLLGQVRTKPGRGDRTLSVSCSDKIARWIHVGIQGALIDMLVDEPIFLSIFVFGGGVPYSEESLKRALLERHNVNDEIMPARASLHQSTLCFPHVRSARTMKPAAGSILWVNVAAPILEVAVLGKKLGITKKTKNFMSSQLSISKFTLYKKFICLVKNSNILKDNENGATIPYNEMKRKSSRYYNNWAKVKETFFRTWTDKGDIWNFCAGTD